MKDETKNKNTLYLHISCLDLPSNYNIEKVIIENILHKTVKCIRLKILFCQKFMALNKLYSLSNKHHVILTFVLIGRIVISLMYTHSYNFYASIPQ